MLGPSRTVMKRGKKAGAIVDSGAMTGREVGLIGSEEPRPPRGIREVNPLREKGENTLQKIDAG